MGDWEDWLKTVDMEGFLREEQKRQAFPSEASPSEEELQQGIARVRAIAQRLGYPADHKTLAILSTLGGEIAEELFPCFSGNTLLGYSIRVAIGRAIKLGIAFEKAEREKEMPNV